MVKGNCDGAYETRVHQDDRRCGHGIRVCFWATIGPFAYATYGFDAHRTLEGANGVFRFEVSDR